MISLFNTYIHDPILSLLVFIYNNASFGDLGVAIIILTLIIRVVLFPLFYKGAKDQSLMQRLQPKIREIQKKNKDNREAQAQALMSLYKENKLNPLSGFLILLLQLPIFIALFQIFAHGLTGDVFNSTMFLNVIDLQAKNFIVVLAAAATQYFQGKLTLSQKNEDTQNNQQGGIGKMLQNGKLMIVFGPILTIVILSGLPSALGLYWTISNVFAIGQQFYINKQLRDKNDHDTA